VSGFCGLIYKHPVPAGSDADYGFRHQLAELMRGVASRGPHASETWVDGRVGLGHHLLREVPEAVREQQPLTSVDGRFVIVFDGRIDNRGEIFANLDSHLRPGLDCPDVEIVLAAHLCWGDDMPRRLLGDFAYAVWDTVGQSLVAVRDPLAGRPFFYVDREEFFAFASHDEALLSLPGISSAPNEDHIARAFLVTLNDYDQFAPWYAELHALNPGHRLCIGQDARVDVSRYRTLPDATPLQFSSDQDVMEAFDSVLSDAVAARLRCYGPSAMLLSGGIDSASVITAARPLLLNSGRASIRTYSAMSDDETTCIESQAIRKLFESGPATPTIVRTPSLEGGMSAEALARLAWDEAHPVDNSLVNHMPLYARAAADGCTSVMNGVGGDIATYISNLLPSELLRSGEWPAAWNEAKAMARNHTYLRHLSARHIFLRSLLDSMPVAVSQRVRRATAALRVKEDSPVSLAETIFSADFIARNNLAVRLLIKSRREPLVSMLDSVQHKTTSLDWMAQGQSGYDRLAGRFGLTSRDVWSDLRLVQFYFGLPLRLRAAGGWTKSLVRAFLRARGQEDVANRVDKQHIGWKFTHRLLERRAERTDGPADSCRCPGEIFASQVRSGHGIEGSCANAQTGSAKNLTYDEFTMKSTVLWLQRGNFQHSKSPPDSPFVAGS
jgi:asparagine synthase (glutamine-hydrolysing)